MAEGQHPTAAEDAVREPAAAPAPHDDPSRWLALVHTMWREVLGVQDIADDVHFYTAGGDSLLLMALVERLRQESGREVRAMDVLRAGTVRRQADLLATTGGR
jgi:aryl carrier-like protein